MATARAQHVSSDITSKCPPAQESSLSLRAAILGTLGTYGDPPKTRSVLAPTPHRALFCRLDDAFDRGGVPLRLRAAPLDCVNAAEGKPGYTLERPLD